MNKIWFVCSVLMILSCRHKIEHKITNYKYFDISESDTISKSALYAVTDEKDLQYGSRVAYVNDKGDTIIPFGKYAYYGTDTMHFYANVLAHSNDHLYGRRIGINQDQQILFDLAGVEIGPEPYNDGLIRVIRNGKMGYADKYGKIVIPCIYDYANWFDNGKAKVTFKAVEYLEHDDHLKVESDEWFEIDKKGNKIKNIP